MIYIIISSILLAYCSNKYLSNKRKEIKEITYNTTIIYFLIIFLSLLIYLKYGLTIDSIKYIFLLPFLIVISIIDYKTTFIYDITISSGIIIQGIILIGSMSIESSFKNNISALIIGFILSFILAKTTKGLGDGDIGLIALCSFVLGYDNVIFLIGLSFMIAFIYCIYIIIVKNKSTKSKIPFGPFISLASILIMLTEKNILIIYFDIIKKVL